MGKKSFKTCLYSTKHSTVQKPLSKQSYPVVLKHPCKFEDAEEDDGGDDDQRNSCSKDYDCKHVFACGESDERYGGQKKKQNILMFGIKAGKM